MNPRSEECAVVVLQFLSRECYRRKLSPLEEIAVMDYIVEELMTQTLQSISINTKEQK